MALAKILGLEVGGELVVLSQAADGSSAEELYTIRGVLKGAGEAIDRSAIYMSLATFRELMVVPEGVHEVVVRKPPTESLDAAAKTVRGMTPEGAEASASSAMPMIAFIGVRSS